MLWNESIVPGTNWQIYESIVKNVVLYGAEECEMNRKHGDRLSAFETDLRQRAVDISRHGKVWAYEQ